MDTSSNLFNLKPSVITVYGVTWCPDCRRAKSFFDRHRINYADVDIDQNPDATPFVKKLNNGMRSVPTIVFPDGEVLTEPSDSQLAQKLGL
jgi:glutaredoxin-like protein